MCKSGCSGPNYVTLDGKKQRRCAKHWIKQTKATALKGKCAFCYKPFTARTPDGRPGAKKRYCENKDCKRLRVNWRASKYRGKKRI